VFHRRGRAIGDFREAWQMGSVKAGLTLRAGVPQSVAMSITGSPDRLGSPEKDKRAALRAAQEHPERKAQQPTNSAIIVSP
jgi:hypothetical protein